VAGFDPELVVLFGSHARGDASPDSDVDLLIVLPITGSRRRLAVAIGRALAGRLVPVDIVVATPDEVERQHRIVGTVIRPAIEEGRVLYRRAA
jgi:predicted nucleotidyltransferase